MPTSAKSIQLKYLARICNGMDKSGVESPDGTIPIYGSGGQFSTATHALYTGDSVLLGRKGTIDKPLFVSGSFWTVDTMYYTKINQELIDPKFFFYLCNTINFEYYKSGSVLPSMTKEDLGAIKFRVMPLDKQQKIREHLDKKLHVVDLVINSFERRLELIGQYRQSLITRAVTKGLDPNVEMKDSGVEWIGSIPREWKTSKISFVSDVTLGKMLCPRQTDSEQTLETYLCAGSISWDGVKDYIKEMWFSSKEKSELLLIAGDVLIVEGGAGFGMTTLYKGEHSPCYFQNSIIRVRGHHNVMTSDFINYWMRFTYTAYLKTVCNEATFSHYTKEKVSETPILVPPLNEQKKIADFCKLVDERVKTICAGIENQISKLNEYRSSLISAAVTGQLAIDEEASA